MKIDLKKLKESKSTKELLNFGLINIDKPAGPTSFSVSDYIRKALDLNKTSHAGTLDPQVSGVLPMMLSRACRLSDFFMHRNKTYVGIMRLHENLDEKKLKEEIKKFIGKINQLPPKKSRVKRQMREREVFSFDIIEIDDKDILFETEVQAGTYIRKLIHDLGENLGGAHMLELRRTQASIFTEDNLVNLYEFDKAVSAYNQGEDSLLREMLIPAEILTEVLPYFQITKDTNIRQLLTGKPLMKKEANIKSLEEGENFILFNNNTFLGVYKKLEEGDLIARPLFVLN
ncbi:MAG: RNA-guided pseudouridylation complex pseudouridine synthase subunit Cbf5 [Nanoarchaeota archaeon]|nr:RNA-guided pseudouridylation complex pseudouridine synthase subunit Cbf5 [Nanoarchaeota archaeon]